MAQRPENLTRRGIDELPCDPHAVCEGSDVKVHADGEAKLLILTGEPIDEPIVGYGPFVMNSEAGIPQAVDDLNSGRFMTAAA